MDDRQEFVETTVPVWQVPCIIRQALSPEQVAKAYRDGLYRKSVPQIHREWSNDHLSEGHHE